MEAIQLQRLASRMAGRGRQSVMKRCATACLPAPASLELSDMGRDVDTLWFVAAGVTDDFPHAGAANHPRDDSGVHGIARNGCRSRRCAYRQSRSSAVRGRAEGQLASIVGARASYLRRLPAPLAGINLQYGLTNHVAKQVKTFSTEGGRTEMRAVTGPDNGHQSFTGRHRLRPPR